MQDRREIRIQRPLSENELPIKGLTRRRLCCPECGCVTYSVQRQGHYQQIYCACRRDKVRMRVSHTRQMNLR